MAKKARHISALDATLDNTGQHFRQPNPERMKSSFRSQAPHKGPMYPSAATH